MAEPHKTPRSVGIWLMVGVVMLLVQIAIGGITRLTDSGLSITNWNIIGGILPPLNEQQWNEAFAAYKEHAALQHQSLFGTEMSLSEFKGIYFWEYFHRLWARLMGFVFLIPFLYFLYRRYLHKKLLIQLGIVVLMAGLAASLGWIMVMSGLDTNYYPWVSPYKLVLHLTVAVITVTYLFSVALQVLQPTPTDTHNKRMARFVQRITVVIWLQIILGGLMSGMKAGGFYNHFPHMQVTADGSWIWIAESLKDKANWSFSNLIYHNNEFAPALVQLFHRGTAYLLCFLIPIFFFTIRRVQISRPLRWGSNILMLALIVQVLLGVFTLLNCSGYKVPVALGVMHQLGGILLLLAILFVSHQVRKGPKA